LEPQQYIDPTDVNAHVCSLPAVMLATPDDIPDTTTAVYLSVVVPYPNRPLPFKPQQYIDPTDVNAHVCALPAIMTITPDDIPDTATAVLLVVVVPSPNRP
jgi:hypothetical protein